MKTLYLHIGTPKTGTTSIQEFCHQNRAVLETKGYCFPRTFKAIGNKGRLRNGVFLASRYIDKDGVRHKELERPLFESGMEWLKGLFDTYENVILTDEDIWRDVVRHRRKLWRDLKEYSQRDGYRVKVIVYLRRQDQLLESSWNQRIKHPKVYNNTVPWEEFVTDYKSVANLDYYNTVKSIAETLGRENVCVRRFDRGSFPGGSIIADFLQCVDLELTDEYIPEGTRSGERNLRFAGNCPEIKRVINGFQDMSLKELMFFENTLAECSALSEASYPCAMFSAAEARAFMEQFEEDNRKLAEEFIGDGQPMFRDNYPEKIKWQKDNPWMLDDVIRSSSRADLQLYRKDQELDTRLTELEKLLQTQQKLLETQNRQIEDQKKQIEEQNKQIQSLKKAVERQERGLKNLIEAIKHPLRTLLRKFKR